MTGIGWIGTLIIGALAGWIAETIMKSNTGLLFSIVLGILGAVVLNAALFAVFGTTLGGWIRQLIVAAAGACLLIVAVRSIGRKA
ncbi:putative membrane protein YeaQ/YmgE (transglycosylase-associated protein family) [Litoreibacter meonggei]|uniref:Putative membrane protein YeaQ/YmgE (Transglycosylase-associated protein family) n=1 Tax=Litoreibacter meonggei TaxID=1049199 RepID=A0A497V6J1_9RHOB|nr:GlsB/YeaQ/YmgE family stress response membrane protein [Litoreibacter meonggei]RLJ36145.1 putative membrane protein YeaQ/YmgE (transglycosylase-associated protein family) [Litoreibacter meonggei]